MVKVKEKRLTQDYDSQNLIAKIREKYELGDINEEELYAQMKWLAFQSDSHQTRFNALRELRLWVKEGQADLEAAKLSQQEIVGLMISALSELPHEKYMAVLKGCRSFRQQQIAKRIKIFDPDEIRAQAKVRMMQKPVAQGASA
jgi:hypothetical protein